MQFSARYLLHGKVDTGDRGTRRAQSGSCGGYLVYRANDDAWPLEDEMVVELESEASRYQYFDLMTATLIPEL
jgi:hypothetical protein